MNLDVAIFESWRPSASAHIHLINIFC